MINVSGTFHDSTIADYGVYEGMEKVYSKTGAKVVIGLAFKIGNKDYLVKSSQQDPTDCRALLLNRTATSIWKLSECGMEIIGGSFQDWKTTLNLKSSVKGRLF